MSYAQFQANEITARRESLPSKIWIADTATTGHYEPVTAQLASTYDWYPFVRVDKPADTATTTHDHSFGIVAGNVTDIWTERPKTAAELESATKQAARETRDTTLTGMIAQLEQWSNTADNHTVTSGNAVATVQVITNNLATFYDGFAKLLRNQYGVD